MTIRTLILAMVPLNSNGSSLNSVENTIPPTIGHNYFQNLLQPKTPLTIANATTSAIIGLSLRESGSLSGASPDLMFFEWYYTSDDEA